MKTLQRLSAALALTLVLALSAFAGEMSTGVAAPPPDSQVATAGQMDTTIVGDMSTGVAATEPATEVALNLLQSLLSLF